MTTILYLSVRVQKEGLNLEVLQHDLGLPSAGVSDRSAVMAASKPITYEPLKQGAGVDNTMGREMV